MHADTGGVGPEGSLDSEVVGLDDRVAILVLDMVLSDRGCHARKQSQQALGCRSGKSDHIGLGWNLAKKERVEARVRFAKCESGPTWSEKNISPVALAFLLGR